MRDLAITAAMLCSIVIGGCKAKIPDGIFACKTTENCPNGQFCHTDGLCHSHREPASRSNDGATLDASVDDGGAGGNTGGNTGGDTSGTRSNAVSSGGAGGKMGAPSGTGGATMMPPKDGPDSGAPQMMMTPPVAPAVASFSTLGARRTDGTITLYDDGFERGGRMCTTDGKFCVTGGFEP